MFTKAGCNSVMDSLKRLVCAELDNGSLVMCDCVCNGFRKPELLNIFIIYKFIHILSKCGDQIERKIKKKQNMQ